MKRLLFCLFLLSLWTGTTQHSLAQVDTPHIWNIGWNADATRFAVGYDNGTLEIRDRDAENILTMFSRDGISELAWSPNDPDLLAIGTVDEAGFFAVELLDVSNSTILLSLDTHNKLVTGLEWNKAGNYLAAAVSLDTTSTWTKDSEIFIWEIVESQVLRSHFYAYPAQTIDWSPDGSQLLFASSMPDFPSMVIDQETGDERLRLDVHAFDAAWSPDGTLIVTAYYDRPLQIWDAHTGERLGQINESEPIWELNWSPDGRFIISIGIGVPLRVWDIASKTSVWESDGATQTDAAWHPDGSKFAYAVDDMLFIWDASTGKLMDR